MMNVSSTRIIFLIIVPLSLSVKAKRKTKIKIQTLYTFLMKSRKSDDSTATY